MAALHVPSTLLGKAINFACKAGNVSNLKISIGAAGLNYGTLHQPVAILLSLNEKSPLFTPSTPAAQADFAQWIEHTFFPENSTFTEAKLLEIDQRLSTSSYLVGGPTATLADLVVLYAASETLSMVSPSKFPSAFRWVDQLAHEPKCVVKSAAETDEPIATALLSALTSASTLRKSLPVNLFQSSSGTSTSTTATTSTTASTKSSSKVEIKEKDTSKATVEKKEKVAKVNTSVDSSSASATADVDPIAEVDLRVGLITKAWKHPESDKLWCESIDVGDSTGPREIASGLQGHFTLEQMAPRRVVVVANLKPRALAKFMSNGMVLCATSPSGKVEFVTPPEGAKIGERISFAGHVGEPAAPSRMDKKKIFETIAPGLVVGDKGICTYKGIPFMTSAGECFVETNPTGSLIK
jgi:aminoacyl tRNA synthase complex-interacting multifunctional protein 1